MMEAAYILHDNIGQLERVLADPQTDLLTREIVAELLVEIRKRLTALVLIAELTHQHGDVDGHPPRHTTLSRLPPASKATERDRSSRWQLTGDLQRLPPMEVLLTAEQYEDKARRCHQLAWCCTNPMALQTFKRLARDYNLMAAALRPVRLITR